MAGKDIIAMSQEDLKRLHLIRKTIDKALTQREAADLMGLCERQVRRIAHRVRQEGDGGVIHRSRGMPSNRRTPDKIRSKVLMLFQDKYPDFGPTFASEKLLEIDRIRVHPETLRLWLITKEIAYKKRKKRPHRQWRERKARAGEMVQMDGSHHAWLEERGPTCVLMGYIDDATGRPFARFHPYEGTFPAMDSFKRYSKKYGLPQIIYLDKHTTYKSPGKRSIQDDLNNEDPLSQFERALKELGVEVIHANSPQAKGRIERLFKTFQDRLVKELRLRNINTIEEANRFLGAYLLRYAKRFGVEPAKPGNLHRPLPPGIDLDCILCLKTERRLRNDFTMAHNRRLYQIEDALHPGKVIVEERIDGSMIIRCQERSLRFKEITTLPKREEPPREPRLFAFRRVTVPAPDHPWRRFRINPQNAHYSQREKGAQKEKGLLLTNS